MGGLSRRAFLRQGAALAAAGAGATLWTPHLRSREAWAQTNGSVVRTEGTTFERTIAPVTDWERYAFTRLAEGPGWPLEVRAELAEPRSGREDRRVPLAAMVQLTDVQVPDAQSPARVEFLAALAEPPLEDVPFRAAHRPHETVVNHLGEAAVRASRQVGQGPVTGRAYDFAVSTGDNVDNMQENELDWFLAMMNGGPLTPNSGDPDRYEGVQDDEVAFYSERYWHPHPLPDGRPSEDNWKRFAGFPALPGFLDAAVRPFACAGIGVPWYSVYGNHDSLVQGTAPENDAFERFATGSVKATDLPAGVSPTTFAEGLAAGDPSALAALGGAPSRPVTADPRRQFLGPAEFIRRHLESGGQPAGHGYTEDNLDRETLYYTFEPVEGIRCISLDTANRLGEARGSIGRAQFEWLEARLQAAHSRWFDRDGGEVRGGGEDRLVIVFGHHNLPTMDNANPSPDDPERVLGPEVEALLHRFPNVIAYVNGHSHVNRVWERPDPAGRTGGFWELSTSAQVDYPAQVRVIEVVDNRDGTLSLFSTIVDNAGPARTLDDPAGADDYGLLELASFGRELAFNDFRDDPLARIGSEDDLNVELVLAVPFDLSTLGATTAPGDEPMPLPAPAADAARALPATGSPVGAGVGAGLVLAGAALGRVVALRNRTGGTQTADRVVVEADLGEHVGGVRSGDRRGP